MSAHIKSGMKGRHCQVIHFYSVKSLWSGNWMHLRQKSFAILGGWLSCDRFGSGKIWTKKSEFIKGWGSIAVTTIAIAKVHASSFRSRAEVVVLSSTCDNARVKNCVVRRHRPCKNWAIIIIHYYGKEKSHEGKRKIKGNFQSFETEQEEEKVSSERARKLLRKETKFISTAPDFGVFNTFRCQNK